jgi:hypothetical protein
MAKLRADDLGRSLIRIQGEDYRANVVSERKTEVCFEFQRPALARTTMLEKRLRPTAVEKWVFSARRRWGRIFGAWLERRRPTPPPPLQHQRISWPTPFFPFLLLRFTTTITTTAAGIFG